MAYVALYRKYRSQTFGDLVGQEHVVRTLQNSLSGAKLAHAYLFTGPRGTGKTSTARLLAKALNCQNGPAAEPCNACQVCQEITAGSCIDVYEMDAASESGVDDVRETIVNTTEYRPTYCRFKVFIIDEVHDLSAKAFDALLKTIEEPPAHVVFVLATTEFNKVPPTIRSRCQKFEFHRAELSDLVERLAYVCREEGVQAEPAALAAIARMADGGYRDALTSLEQALLTADGPLTLAHVYDQLGLIADEVSDGLLVATAEGDLKGVLERLDQVNRQGRDPRAVLESLLARLGDLTRSAYGVTLGALADATLEATLHATAAQIGKDNILRLRGALAQAHRAIRDVSMPRLWLESELARLALPAPAPVSASVGTQPAQPVSAAPPAHAKAPPPKPATKPVEKPQPAVHADEPKPSPARSSPPPTGIWGQALAELQRVSKTLHAKLASTQLSQTSPESFTIEFRRELDREWFQEKPKALDEVEKVLAKLAGVEKVKLELKLTKTKTESPMDQTVEIPVEGERLQQMAREVFEGF